MTEKPKTRKSPAKGGRPVYRPSIAERQTVEEMKFVGESDNTIARSLGIDPDTLRKHFTDELASGYAQRRKEGVGLLFQSARSGNVSAQKKLEEMGRVAGAQEAVKGREKAEPRRGKKEERQIAAENVQGGFVPPAAPKLFMISRRLTRVIRPRCATFRVTAFMPHGLPRRPKPLMASPSMVQLTPMSRSWVRASM